MKLLILAHDYPPLVSIGGLRPASWYKYLNDFGVEVTVVTRDWEYELNKTNTTSASQSSEPVIENGLNRKLVRVRTPKNIKDTISAILFAHKFAVVRRSITYLFCFLEFLSLKFDITAEIYEEADKVMQKEKFDFIVATGKPFILFRYAALLSKKYNTPWIADYRDSWTQNHVQSNYRMNILESILNGFYKLMERKYVSTAQLVLTVAPSYIQYLPAYTHHKTAIIYNGYDNDIEQLVADTPASTDKFIIAYAGIIYPMQRVEVFLQGALDFVKQNNIRPGELEIHFWGIDQQAISRIGKFNTALNEYIQVHNKISYFEVMKQLSRANLLLLLSADSDHWLNAKLFDYLVLKRPVLMVGNQSNIMADILKETNAGVTIGNAAAVAEFIAARYNTYKAAEPNNTVNYQQYSRKNQVAAFYQALKNLKRPIGN